MVGNIDIVAVEIDVVQSFYYHSNTAHGEGRARMDPGEDVEEVAGPVKRGGQESQDGYDNCEENRKGNFVRRCYHGKNIAHRGSGPVVMSMRVGKFPGRDSGDVEVGSILHTRIAAILSLCLIYSVVYV
jgi:hypothetical protein